MKYLPIILSLVFLLSCEQPLRPEDPKPLDPVPEHYLDLFIEVEACSGIGGFFDEIEWFVVEPEEWPVQRLGGLFSKPNKIYMDRFHIEHDLAVRHEMLHFLLRDVGGHPPAYFDEPPCGPLVS